MSVTTIGIPGGEIRICDDAQQLAAEAAGQFSRLADQYVVGAGRFTVALSGGSTPRAMLSLLAGEPFSSRIPWSSIFFFWSDERAVVPSHPGSNFRMANDTLLSRVPVPPGNVFRIPGEMGSPEQAAVEYSDALKQFFGGGSGALGVVATSPLGNWPRLDLILLGMGSDGHTASLFPRTEALNISDRIAAANYVQKLNAHRITLTVPTINNARNVLFLVSGEDKSAALKSVIEGPQDPRSYPSQLIRPKNGTLTWLVDQAAAASLSQARRSS